MVPIFFEGELMFWALARSHHADMGAPLPTTYLPKAATIYEEGLNFPCVRVQEDFADKKDWIRYAMHNIRASNIWYGDYRAQVGACRVGERRLQALVRKYGVGTIRGFIDEWMAYSARRMEQEIRHLPAGSWSYETRHDPIPGVAEEGVPVRVQRPLSTRKRGSSRSTPATTSTTSPAVQSVRGVRDGLMPDRRLFQSRSNLAA